MRIAWFPHSLNPAYAGVRLRCLIPSSVLRSYGHEVVLYPRPSVAPFTSVIVQAKWLLDTNSSDEMSARMTNLLSLKRLGAILVLDSFDNYFVNETDDPVRGALLATYRQCLSEFDIFTVSSPGLVPFMKDALGPHSGVTVIGDPIEGPNTHALYEPLYKRVSPLRWPGAAVATIDRFNVRRRRRYQRQLIWFGNQGTKYAAGGMIELQRIFAHLAKASKEVPLHLTVVSNSRQRYEEVMAEAAFSHSYRDWNRIYFPAFLRQHDLVVLPTAITPFTASKSNNRLILPIFMGVPVIADALPDYIPWHGYFSLGEWDKLAYHLNNLQALRTRASTACGILKKSYSPDAIAESWVRLLAQPLSDRP